jgi:hypothetical protein
MTRFGTLVTSTVVAALLSVVPDASGQVRSVLPRGDHSLRPIAAALHGSVEGKVVDDAGVPVAGATVSALGATSALAVSDTTGHFHLYGLPAGPYLVRAHLTGYIPFPRRQFVEVRHSARTNVAVSLRRTDRTRVLTAGFGSTSGGDSQATDDHSDVAWYLRHVPRSVLKDVTASDAAAGGDEKAPDRDGGGPLSRAIASPAHFATNLFDELPLTGQVNLLTASSFDAVDRLFSSETSSHSVAALSVGGPVGAWGDWAFQGITAQGDLGTWFLAGSFKSHAPAAHVYDVNVAYATQRFSSPLTEFPRSASGDSRAVGSVFAVDRWRLARQVALTYGARYSRYDYLTGPGLLSPRAELELKPVAGLRIRTSVSRAVLVPGAEEFLPPLAAGLWVPSERTFDWLSPRSLTAERADNYEFVIERELRGGYAVSARTFYQEVSNQLVALFGSGDRSSALPGSHYHVGTMGDVDAKGWSVSLSNAANAYVHGSITYQMTKADWIDVTDPALLGLIAASRLGARAADFHDLTTSVETEVPGVGTRVFMLYKIDSAFARSGNESRPGVDGRFDVQVSQPLPVLDFTSAQWQIVFAVRNMFRENTPGASVYDELLVVRPPKRLVGGLVVRF